jgi:hypothetical protein
MTSWGRNDWNLTSPFLLHFHFQQVIVAFYHHPLTHLTSPTKHSHPAIAPFYFHYNPQFNLSSTSLLNCLAVPFH